MEYPLSYCRVKCALKHWNSNPKPTVILFIYIDNLKIRHLNLLPSESCFCYVFIPLSLETIKWENFSPLSFYFDFPLRKSFLISNVYCMCYKIKVFPLIVPYHWNSNLIKKTTTTKQGYCLFVSINTEKHI